MGKRMWYNVKSSQTWLNLTQAEAIFRNGNVWTVRLRSGNEVGLTEDEYWEVMDILRSPVEHQEQRHNS